MRILCVALLALLLPLNGLHAAVPTDGIPWSGTYSKPTSTGRLRKVQIYALVNLTADDRIWWQVDHCYRAVVKLNDHRFLTGGIFAGGMPDMEAGQEVDPILRTADDGLLRAFAGDASAVVLVIGADGRISRIERISGFPGPTFQSIVAEAEGVTPLIEAENAYPAAAAPVLRALRAGDFRLALATAKRLREDGAQIMQVLPERIALLVAEEARVLDQPGADPAAQMFAAERLQAVLREWPQLPEAKTIAATLKRINADERIIAERKAWAAFEAYVAAARKTPPRKLPEMMKSQLAGIQAAFPDTHAAAVARMIHTAAGLD